MTGIRREYVAEVVSVGKQKNKIDWELKLAPRPQMQYPDTIYGKAETETLVKPLQAGQRYTFVLERDRLKPNKQDGSTRDWDYYETLLEVRAAPAAAPAQGGATGVPPGNRASEFRTPEQMIRGVALEQATALAVALGNENLRSAEVLLVASKFERYIATGDIPKLPEPPLSPKAQADKDMTDLFGSDKASPSPVTGGVTSPPVSAQAPTAAAGTLLPTARQPGPTGEEINKASLAKHIATLAASAPAGAVQGGGAPETSHGQQGASTPTLKRPPESVKSYTELLRVCNIDFHMQPKQVLAELNATNVSELAEPPPMCYIRIAAVHGQQPPKEEAR